ncbi:MAG: hypothetical protein KDC42_09265 [Ignavibacteriae bacterium]|nr:hypothetical protein [Ignavibacteriota bacterium]
MTRLLKHLTFLFLLQLIHCNLLAQRGYDGIFENHFFGYYPSARMEAMGRGFVSVEGDPNSYFVNPAALGTLQGLSLTGGIANNYHGAEDPQNKFLSASYNFKKIGTIGVSRDYSDLGSINFHYSPSGRIQYTPYYETYRLSYARELFKDFWGGFNLGLFHYNENGGKLEEYGIPDINDNVFMLDIGLLKKIVMVKGDYDMDVDLAFSVFNLNQGSLEFNPYDIESQLPVISRLGASYDLRLNIPGSPWNTTFLKILYTLEYQEVLNATFYDGIKTGLELTLFEIFSLRGGFYALNNERVSSIEGWRYGNINEFTFGLGVIVPFKTIGITKIPFTVKFDAAIMPQPAYITQRPTVAEENYKNINIFNLTANIQF